MVSQTPTEYGLRPNTLTIPELEQSKAAVHNTLASVHSRRSYTFAIDRFIVLFILLFCAVFGLFVSSGTWLCG